jgi:hypothetical protein
MLEPISNNPAAVYLAITLIVVGRFPAWGRKMILLLKEWDDYRSGRK